MKTFPYREGYVNTHFEQEVKVANLKNKNIITAEHFQEKFSLISEE